MHTQTNLWHVLFQPVGQQCNTVLITNLVTNINPTFKLLPRPVITHFVYEFSPLIDEQNKAQQNNQALEDHWPTKCCWFRLVTAFVGMAVVDLHRWDRSKHNGIKGHFNIKRMCDLSGQPLIDATLQYCNDDDDDKREKYRVQQCHHMTMQGLQQVSTLHSYKVSKRMVNYATTKRRHSSDIAMFIKHME